MTTSGSRRFPQAESRLAYEIARTRLETRLFQIDALDSKVISLLGFGSGLLAILVAFLALNTEPLSRAAIGLFSAATAIYFTLVAVSLRGYQVRKWEVGPARDEVWKYAGQFSANVLGWWAAESYECCTKHNEEGLGPKIDAAKWGVRLIFAETGTLVAGIAVVALS